MRTAEDVMAELAEIGAIGVEPPRKLTLVAPVVPVAHVEVQERLTSYNEHIATLGPLLDAFQANLKALNEWAEKTREFGKPIEDGRDG